MLVGDVYVSIVGDVCVSTVGDKLSLELCCHFLEVLHNSDLDSCLFADGIFACSLPTFSCTIIQMFTLLLIARSQSRKKEMSLIQGRLNRGWFCAF